MDSIAAESSDDSATWGSPLVYAAIHQMGGEIVPREAAALWLPAPDYGFFASGVQIPARPYLGLGEAERRMMDDVVGAWIERHFTGG